MATMHTMDYGLISAIETFVSSTDEQEMQRTANHENDLI